MDTMQSVGGFDGGADGGGVGGECLKAEEGG